MKRMKTYSVALLASLLFLLAVSACNNEGFEGNASISGTVLHHSAPIPFATVYINFGAKELPGTTLTDFDASVVADRNGDYVIKNLKKGNYYLYGFGYDSTIIQSVKGGLPVVLAKDEDKKVNVAVTE